MEEQFRLLVEAALAGTMERADLNFGAHPQGHGWPGIVMNVIDNLDDPHMKGTDGLWRGRVQVDSYATEYVQARNNALAVIRALNGHRGDGFQGIFLISRRDGRDTSTTDRPFRVSMDFATTWSENNA